MNKHSIAVLFGFSLAATLAVAQQEGSAVFDGGWRISAGGVYDSGVKTKMHFSPSMDAVPGGRMSQAEAQADGWGKPDGDNVKYVNHRVGKESTLSQDVVYPQEGGGNTDVSYQVPREVWVPELDEFELGYAEYDNEGGFMTDDRDATEMFGINVELSRNLYHDADNGWGIDAGFAVQYGRRHKAYRASSAWGGGGYYRTYCRPDDAELLDDPDLADYYWGSSGVRNIVISSGNIIPDAGPIVGDSNAFNVEGDYEDLELMLLAHPYYDIYEWLRFNTTIGVVASRQEMEMSFSMMQNGASIYRSRHDFSQWDVYGVAGLGLMLYYNDFTLSGDFLARFLDRDMDISDRYYRGKVGRGDWMFKVSLGYEF